MYTSLCPKQLCGVLKPHSGSRCPLLRSCPGAKPQPWRASCAWPRFRCFRYTLPNTFKDWDQAWGSLKPHHRQQASTSDELPWRNAATMACPMRLQQLKMQKPGPMFVRINHGDVTSLTQAAGVHFRRVALAQRPDHGMPHALGHVLPGPAVAPEKHQARALRRCWRLIGVDTPHQIEQLLGAAVGRDDDVLCARIQNH